MRILALSNQSQREGAEKMLLTHFGFNVLIELNLVNLFCDELFSTPSPLLPTHSLPPLAHPHASRPHFLSRDCDDTSRGATHTLHTTPSLLVVGFVPQMIWYRTARPTLRVGTWRRKKYTAKPNRQKRRDRERARARVRVCARARERERGREKKEATQQSTKRNEMLLFTKSANSSAGNDGSAVTATAEAAAVEPGLTC